jgi:hypothetical protein
MPLAHLPANVSKLLRVAHRGDVDLELPVWLQPRAANRQRCRGVHLTRAVGADGQRGHAERTG